MAIQLAGNLNSQHFKKYKIQLNESTGYWTYICQRPLNAKQQQETPASLWKKGIEILTFWHFRFAEKHLSRKIQENISLLTDIIFWGGGGRFTVVICLLIYKIILCKVGAI